MKRILKQRYSEGNTPIRPEDAAQPILEISALHLAPKCSSKGRECSKVAANL
jgi:hypothetical protein